MRTIIRDNYDPQLGDYHERIVVDEARQKSWLFDCDGVFLPYNDVEVVNEKGESTTKAVSQKLFTDEIDRLDAEDTDIWTEIENIEAASDVVDVVGTYAELQQYDTSKLHDNDLIKVLADETHDGEIAYYRWNDTTETFSYVGAEGPYYTQSQIDTMMSGKQDTLIAGTNIQIAADGVTISATDTTYTHFTGATASADGVQGLVPGPLAGDEDKVLKGDGTWGDAATNTIFYMDDYPEYTTALYTDDTLTTVASASDLKAALAAGGVRICQMVSGVASYYYDISGYNTAADSYSIGQYDDSTTVYTFTFDTATTIEWEKSESQAKLTAGSNITINGATISATDTTYTAGVGIDITNNQIKSVSVIRATLDSPSAGYAVLKAGTTPLDVMNVHNYIDRFGSNVILGMGGNEYATIIGELPADADGIHYLFEYGNLIYDFAVGLNATKYTVTDTQAAMTGASAGAAGTKGLVPAPALGQQNNFLRGDGTWAAVPVLYTTQGQNEDGAVTQKLFTDTVGNIEAALQILNSGAGVP